MQIATYKDAVDYLESFIGKVRFRIDSEFLKQHDPLERMRALLSLLDNPQNKFPSVLVGGTSGKGSTSYLISHILTTAGYKTGFTLSPHLQQVNERLQINGKSISDEDFVSLLNSILYSIEGMKKMAIGTPSYFEILIAMAFLYFVKQKVDIAVVEVGMGGEFDATNTLYPLISVLTNVGLDHTNILGKTVEKIARTKAGIIKKLKVEKGKLKVNSQLSTLNSQLIVVSGVKQPSVIEMVEDRCKKAGAELNLLGRDFNYEIRKEDRKGIVFDLTISSGRGLQLNGLELSLLGEYQVENASLSIEAVLKLKKFGFEILENAIKKALKTAFFPGRFEILKIDSLLRRAWLTQDKISSTLILDGAHNPVKMKGFLKSLKKFFPKERKVFIIGFKFDKDILTMLKQIIKIADKIIATEFHAKTDMSVSACAKAESIKHEVLSIKYKNVTVEKDLKKALKKAIKISKSETNSIIVITGSLYLVGEIRNML